MSTLSSSLEHHINISGSLPDRTDSRNHLAGVIETVDLHQTRPASLSID